MSFEPIFQFILADGAPDEITPSTALSPFLAAKIGILICSEVVDVPNFL